MNQELKAEIYGKGALPDIQTFLEAWDWGDGGASVVIKKISSTIGHRALFWIWMRQLAKNFSARGEEDFTDKKMHDLMCHQFLGYTEGDTIGKTQLNPTMRTLTHPEELKGTDFGHFLSQIDAWAAQVGVLLVTQSNSDYAEYKEANS